MPNARKRLVKVKTVIREKSLTFWFTPRCNVELVMYLILTRDYLASFIYKPIMTF